MPAWLQQRGVTAEQAEQGEAKLRDTVLQIALSARRNKGCADGGPDDVGKDPCSEMDMHLKFGMEGMRHVTSPPCITVQWGIIQLCVLDGMEGVRHARPHRHASLCNGGWRGCGTCDLTALHRCAMGIHSTVWA